jgi:hypothetical protein
MVRLKFRVLKIRAHETKEDAEDIKPFLKGLDVVSSEHDFISESLARTFETYVLARQIGFDSPEIRNLDRLIREPSREFGGYFSRLFDILVEMRIPLAILERLPDQESERRIREAKAVHKIPCLKVFRGDIDSVCEIVFNQLEEVRVKRTEGRDRLMGENSRTILNKILELYPSLIKRSEVNYGVIVGCSHYPEKYIEQNGFETRVIEVPASREIRYNVSETVGEMRRRGAKREDLNDLLATRALIYALAIVGAGTQEQLVRDIETNLVGRANYTDVKELFDKLARTTMDRDGRVSEAQQDLVIGYTNRLLITPRVTV